MTSNATTNCQVKYLSHINYGICIFSLPRPSKKSHDDYLCMNTYNQVEAIVNGKSGTETIATQLICHLSSFLFYMGLF